MAIESIEVIKFSDERLRPIADEFSKLYNKASAISNEWTARELGELIPDSSTEILFDSAYGTGIGDGDGRPVVTGEKLHKVIILLKELLGSMEKDNKDKLNTVLSVAVNTH